MSSQTTERIHAAAQPLVSAGAVPGLVALVLRGEEESVVALLPLIAHPGERWLYNTGAGVLGVLLTRAAQAPLDEVLRAHPRPGWWQPRVAGAAACPSRALDRMGFKASADKLLALGVGKNAWATPTASGYDPELDVAHKPTGQS